MEGNVSDSKLYKCRKCRLSLFKGDYVVNAHSKTVHGDEVNPKEDSVCCASLTEKDTVWYLKDDNLPAWVEPLINQANWIKGKLTCPKCNGRIGSFDYVCGSKCQCGDYVLPAVHVVRGKIDCDTMGLLSKIVTSTDATEKHETEGSKEVEVANR